MPELPVRTVIKLLNKLVDFFKKHNTYYKSFGVTIVTIKHYRVCEMCVL